MLHNQTRIMSKRKYITTPIYYVNGAPHIGSSLTTAVCDFERRYRIMRGEPVWFLTGTDENATKVREAAEAAGKDPMEFATETAQKFVEAWKFLDIQYDDFIRTTEDRHKVVVQALFNKLTDNGYIYLDKYEGWYDVGAEAFVREADLVDGKSPDGNEVRWVEEENYFFKLSAFGDRLLEHIRANPTFLLPESRKNEVVKFVESGLRDMCITRQNTGWGIPVPGDDTKVIYVWFDALINYLSATGWPNAGWEDLWPADVHWMAKEIFTRFHATLWPAILMGADLPLPKTVIAHGWFTFGGEKISKSKGGLISPVELSEHIIEVSGCSPELSIDVIRYSLAALLPYEGDTNYSYEEVERRYNADLANDLGNALNRSLSMAQKFVAGVVPSDQPEGEVLEEIARAKADYEGMVTAFRWDQAVDRAIALIRFLNKYIDTRAPWALAKASDPSLPAVIRGMLLCLRAAEGLICPIMPTAADAIAGQLGLKPLESWAEIGSVDSLPAGTSLGQPQPMFPRIDLKAQAAKTQEKPQEKKPMSEPAAPAPEKTEKPTAEPISIDDFAKVELRVARVLEAEEIEGSDRLLKLQLVIGEERRQVVAGIKANYAPIDLVGRQVVIVFNLKPAKLRGVESQGMLLAAVDESGGAILLTPEKEAPDGAKVR